MTWTQGVLLGIAVVMFIYLGFAMFKPRVLDGLHLDHRHPGGGPGPHVAVPRLLHGCGLRRPGPLPRWAERPVYRALGTGPDQEQNWKRYASSMIIFSAVALGVTYLIIRIQGSLPLNPQHSGQCPRH